MIKSKLNEKEPLVINYPCLMQGPFGGVVMMLSHGAGILVHKEPNNENMHEVGYYTEKWNMGNFNIFDGVVTLSNNK